MKQLPGMPAGHTSADIDKLDSLGTSLMTKALEQVALKRSIEDRWIEDVRHYNSRYDAETESVLDQDKSGSSKIFVGLTRSKTTAAESRVADMLFPSDDRNWAIRPTPEPDFGPMPAEIMETLRARQEEASVRAHRMENKIEDQLTEARYIVTARDIIHDAAMLGTGIVKGPVVVNHERKMWRAVTDDVYELAFEQEHRPHIERVDPWDFFPDMSARKWQDVEFVFERKLYTRKQLRQLKGRPGYREDAIDRILATDPREQASSNHYMQQLREIAGNQQIQDDGRFEFWEYHGPLSKEDIEAAVDARALSAEEYEEHEGVVTFCNGIVAKVVLHPMDTEDSIYSVFNWEDDDGSIFGFGVPYLMRSPQRVINASWRMMLQNAALSVGPQVVIDSNAVRPADGSHAMRTAKVWVLTDRSRSVRDVFATHDIKSYQPELMQIFEAGKRLADEETSLPMIAQGEQGELPERAAQTATGMSMLMNAANVVLRRIIKRWDDDVTRPLITRFYDFNMQFSPDGSIKGDFEVDARGSSALMVKETQVHALALLMQFGESPIYGPMTKHLEVYRRYVEANRISPDDVVKTKEEMEAEAAQQTPAEDPAAALEQQKLELQAAMHQQKLQDRELDRQAKLRDTEIKERSKQDMLGAEMLLKQNMGSGI